MNRLLDKEWFLRLLALLLAIGLWAAVHPGWRPAAARKYLVPLQTWGLPQDKAVRLANPKVWLGVSMPVGMAVNPNHLAAGVVVAGLSPGWHRLAVQTRLPLGVRLVQINPSIVRVLVERLGQRTLALEPKSTAAPPAGLALRQLRVEPRTLRFWGLTSDLPRVKRLQVAYSPPARAGDFRETGPITALDDRGRPVPGIELRPATATVSGQAYALAPVSLPVLAITAGHVPAGYAVTALQVSPPTLAVAPGTASLPANLVTQAVAVDGHTADFTVQVPVVFPAGITPSGSGSVQVTVSITAKGG